MPEPLILVTNDDGIRSPGLREVARAVADLGELLIVAPREQQTSMGRAFHGRGIARSVVYVVNRRRVRAFAVRTSPAIVVRHAVLLVADRMPSLIISGINYGENIGNGVTISGTVGAALEGACLGVPAIAVSLQTDIKYHRTHSRDIDFAVAAHFARRFARHLLKHGLPKGVDILNINVPDGASRSTRWRWTRVSRKSYFRSMVRESPSRRRFSGYEQIVAPDAVEADSDINALLHDKMASVSPLTLDLTAHVSKRVLANWARQRREG